MEIWGRCATCEVWFPCRDWFDRAAPQPVCPTCGAEPTAIENRTVVISLVDEELAPAS